MTAPEINVRVDWASELRNAYQRAVGGVLEGDPRHVPATIRRLKEELHPPANPAESLILRQSLALFVDRLARLVHRQFHVNFDPRPCTAVPVVDVEEFWMTSELSIDALLDRWCSAYTAWFDEHHAAPAALRAHDVLDRHFSDPLTLDSIARFVGCSTTTLKHQFKRVYGVSVSEYLARTRVREGIRRLRDSGDSVEVVARRTGYQSGNKFYARVRTYTGLTPAQVRTLTKAEFDRLLETRLSLRVRQR